MKGNYMNSQYIIDMIEEIQELAMWHYDPDVDETDESPDDGTYHTNGYN